MSQEFLDDERHRVIVGLKQIDDECYFRLERPQHDLGVLQAGYRRIRVDDRQTRSLRDQGVGRRQMSGFDHDTAIDASVHEGAVDQVAKGVVPPDRDEWLTLEILWSQAFLSGQGMTRRQ